MNIILYDKHSIEHVYLIKFNHNVYMQRKLNNRSNGNTVVLANFRSCCLVPWKAPLQKEEKTYNMGMSQRLYRK